MIDFDCCDFKNFNSKISQILSDDLRSIFLVRSQITVLISRQIAGLCQGLKVERQRKS